MTPVLNILSVFPDILNVNGDAENAAVLAARSRWAGHSAKVLRYSVGEALPAEAPGIVIVGSTSDVALPSVIAALTDIRSAFSDWINAGIPVLAVGTGWEMLSESIELSGTTVAGLDVLPGRAVAAPSRVSDDLVVTTAYGRLIGYENHARDMVLDADATPLGDIVYGRGNGAGASAEGVIFANAVGTHLHGPVLAKNPGLADHFLQLALGEGFDPRTVPAGRVDDIARAARNAIATRLEIDIEV